MTRRSIAPSTGPWPVRMGFPHDLAEAGRALGGRVAERAWPGPRQHRGPARLARGAAKAGDRAAAAQEYLRILQIAPDQPEAWRELGRLGRPAGI